MTTILVGIACLIVGWFGHSLILAKRMPFFREVQRLIAERPEYAEGIEQGTVHLQMFPGYGLKPKKKEPKAEPPDARGLETVPIDTKPCSACGVDGGRCAC